jgi:tetratricopeptide (TPR) repeat protein
VLDRVQSMLSPATLLECQGNLHFYRHELQEAVHKYEQAMQIDHDYDAARYHYIVGVQMEREQDFVGAFKRYQAAIEIEPTFVDSYIELGGLLVKASDYEGALTCYTDAVRLDPNDLGNLSNRASVLEVLQAQDGPRFKEQYRVALAEFEAAKQRLPAIDEAAQW